ncbi:MAG: S-layer homology domain-containing protein [bacterium]|nr:S-layer homology domain-containing protein [bacterium]
MKKKLMAMGITACMITSSLSGFAADISEFSDIPEGWAHDAVVYAVNNGILKGENNHVFPERLLTRAELAAIIGRALSLSERADISAYTDVSEEAWYYGDMAAAVKAGIFQGYDGKLNPEAAITREEVFAVIARAYAFNSDNGDLSAFDDADAVADWAKASAAALVENGYINGDGGKLRPKDNITRAELAQILYKISVREEGSSGVSSTAAAEEAASNPETTSSPEATVTPSPTTRVIHSGGGGGGGSYKTSYSLDDASKVEVDGATYYYAELPKAMTSYNFKFDGKTVTATAVNDEKTIVKYTPSDVKLDEMKYAKTALTYGEYWYTETSDGYSGEPCISFKKDAKAETIPDTYTAAQSAEDAYGAVGADTDAGMYDAVSRATTGYGLGRLSFTQTVMAQTASGEEKQFKSGITEKDGVYTVVRPENAAEEFGYNASSNRGSNGSFKALGYENVTVAVSRDMEVNAEILKNVDGYKEQAQAVSDKIASLSFDESLSSVYDYKELNANGLYGKRVVNEEADVKDIGTISEANTTDDNKFTVNTKYGRRYGDVTFLIYFDGYKDMKSESGYGSDNINGDDKTNGKVGEFKNYVYNVTKAKIEYLGADGTAEPVIAGAKFGSDIWISPNHGPVVEIAVTKSYDRFKAMGDGKYRITLMADGYKDVTLETSAGFEVYDPLKMQGDDDDVDEIVEGSDLVLKYDIVNRKYVEALKTAVESGTANVTLTSGSGRDQVTEAESAKLADENGVLTVTFENIKDKLKRDTQYAVNFPTLDYNDTDKLGMTASVHYAPATETYAIMNIPYEAFYGAENVSSKISDSSKVNMNYDAVSSATNKVGNYGKSGGAYHTKKTAEIAEDGTITAVGGENGASNEGVIWPVRVKDIADLAALGGNAVTDDSEVTVATFGRGQTSSTELKGYQTLMEAPEYSYYVLSEVPAYYMDLTVADGKPVFTANSGTAATESEITPNVTYGSNWGDVQIGLSGAESVSDKQINAVVITAKDKDNNVITAGLMHLYNIWSYSDIAWRNSQIEGLNGATVTNVRYYCNAKDENSAEPTYYIYDYPMNAELLPAYEGEVTAEFNGNEIVLSNLPEDAANLKAQVYHTTGGRNPVYTYLTPLAVDPADDDIDPVTVDVTDGKITISSGSVTNSAGTTQTYGEPLSGTTYTIALSSDNYAPFTVQAEYTAAETYAIMNIPYEAFYGAENVSSKISDSSKVNMNYDAVSSATNKVGNYGKSGGAYHTKKTAEIAEDGTITAVGGENGASNEGVIWPVRVKDIADLAALGGNAVTDDSEVTVATFGRGQTSSTELKGYQTLMEAPEYSYYVLSEVPAYYMDLTVADGKPVFTANSGTAATESEITPNVTYGSNWGDVQIGLSGAESVSDKQINAVVITAKDKDNNVITAGLMHLYNIWSYSDIAWRNSQIEGLNGATVTNVRYYCNAKDENSAEPTYYIYDYPMNAELLPAYEGEVTAEFNGNEIVLSNLPEDAANLKAQVYHTTGGRNPVYTYLTPLAVDPADDDIDPVTVDVTDGKITISSGSVTNSAGTTQTYGEPLSGTTYTIALSSDNYAPFTVQAEYTAE